MEIVISSLITLSVLGLFVFVRWSKTRSIIEPGVFFAANLILLYPVRALVLYGFEHASLPSDPGVANFSSIANTSWVAMLGCLGFVCGYLVVMGKRSIALLKEGALKQTNEVITIAVLFGLSIIGMSYKIATGDYISYLLAEDRSVGLSQIGSILTSLQWPAYIGAWVLWLKGERSTAFRLLFLGILIVVIPYQVIQGSKTFLSLLLVSAVVAFYWVRRRLPKLSSIVAIYLVTIFIFPFVHNFREIVNSDYGAIPSISNLDIVKILTLRDEQSAREEAQRNPLLEVSARYGGIDELYGVMQTVPDVLGYRYGFEYTAVLVNFVPRLLWQDKPIYSRGADYGAALGTITSITPFPIGEAYWDLGEYGVPIMMMIWGGFLAGVVRAYDRYYKTSRYSFLIAVYFLSQIYWISGGESSMPMVLAGMPQQIALLLVVAFIIGGTQRFIRKIKRHEK
jgi:hypothetical protein